MTKEKELTMCKSEALGCSVYLLEDRPSNGGVARHVLKEKHPHGRLRDLELLGGRHGWRPKLLAK